MAAVPIKLALRYFWLLKNNIDFFVIMGVDTLMQIYAAYHKKRQQQQQLVQFGSVVLLVFLLFITIILVRHLTRSTVISPLTAHASNTQKPRVLLLKKRDPTKLKAVIANALDDSIPEYSITVDDFLTTFHVELGSQIPYTAASINKLAIVTTLYNQIQKGTVLKDTTIAMEEADRQDYGTGSMRYERNGTKYTVQEMAELMMKKSDNTAAYILARKVLTVDDIQQNVNSWGLGSTNINENTTTNNDMDLLFRKLFTGTILNATYTREVINMLDDSDFEDRIPALLPNNAKVFHKVGTAIAGLHDVGVVMGHNSLYYIGIFTNGVSDEERATKAIARVSKAVYDFMQEQ